MELKPEMERPDDQELTAYLDGELQTDAAKTAVLEASLTQGRAARLRLAMLAAGGRPFRTAYDVLAELAPIDRLQAGLDNALAAHGQKVVPMRSAKRRWITPELMAASLAFLLAGTAAGVALAPRFAEWAGVPAGGVISAADDPDSAWMLAVANQVGLEDQTSVASLVADPARQAIELQQVGARLGFKLDRDVIDLPGLEFKQARLLNFGGKPIVQLLYSSPGDGPVALCLSVEDDETPERPKLRQIDTINLRYWREGTRGMLLVGRIPQARLAELASTVGNRKL